MNLSGFAALIHRGQRLIESIEQLLVALADSKRHLFLRVTGLNFNHVAAAALLQEVLDNGLISDNCRAAAVVELKNRVRKGIDCLLYTSPSPRDA